MTARVRTVQNLKQINVDMMIRSRLLLLGAADVAVHPSTKQQYLTFPTDIHFLPSAEFASRAAPLSLGAASRTDLLEDGSASRDHDE